MTNTVLINETCNIFCIKSKEEWLDNVNYSNAFYT